MANLNSESLKEYRVTRPGLYGPGTPGHTKASARQGHYVTAESAAEAALAVSARSPSPTHVLDVQSETDTDSYGDPVRYVYASSAWRKEGDPCPHCGK